MTVSQYILQKVKERLEHFKGFLSKESQKPKSVPKKDESGEDKKSLVTKILDFTSGNFDVVTDAFPKTEKYLENSSKDLRKIIEENEKNKNSKSKKNTKTKKNYKKY